MCGTIDPGSCIRCVLGFGIKTGYDNGGGGFFFNSTAWVRQRRADAMVAGLGEPKFELRCMKRDEV
jgi:hypothetical protein